MMTTFRENRPIEVAGLKVATAEDYKASVEQRLQEDNRRNPLTEIKCAKVLS